MTHGAERQQASGICSIILWEVHKDLNKLKPHTEVKLAVRGINSNNAEHGLEGGYFYGLFNRNLTQD